MSTAPRRRRPVCVEAPILPAASRVPDARRTSPGPHRCGLPGAGGRPAHRVAGPGTRYSLAPCARRDGRGARRAPVADRPRCLPEACPWRHQRCGGQERARQAASADVREARGRAGTREAATARVSQPWVQHTVRLFRAGPDDLLPGSCPFAHCCDRIDVIPRAGWRCRHGQHVAVADQYLARGGGLAAHRRGVVEPGRGRAFV